MKKTIRLLICILLIALVCFSVSVGESVNLSVGAKGDQVLQAKQRLYELGYFINGKLTKTYTEDTAEKVRFFQQLNHLEETGILTEADWAVLFSEEAVKAPLPTPAPYATPAPFLEPEIPPRDEDGYLIDEKEYIYEDEEAGHWLYISHDLQVSIVRREDSRVPLIWFETDIRVREDERIYTVDADPSRPAKKYLYPFDIARNNQAVLAFSDDFYGDRVYHKKTLGVIIREGNIISEETYKKAQTTLPNLDMLVQYGDGRLKAMPCGAYSAQELLESGAINVFSFGPVMITEGRMTNHMLSGHYSSKEPRQALGMIEPGHYFLVSVQGRLKSTVGCDLWHIAGIMLEHGVTEAMNLDGGNTVALVFMGKMLNKPGYWNNKKAVRTLTSMICVGHSDLLQ